MQRIKDKAPQSYMPQVLDTEKRLNLLFDHLNNGDSLKPDTIEQLKGLAQAVQSRQHDTASAVLTELMKTKTDEGSNWMVSHNIMKLKLVLKYVSGRCQTIDNDEQSNASIGALRSDKIKASSHRRVSWSHVTFGLVAKKPIMPTKDL